MGRGRGREGGEGREGGGREGGGRGGRRREGTGTFATVTVERRGSTAREVSGEGRRRGSGGEEGRGRGEESIVREVREGRGWEGGREGRGGDIRNGYVCDCNGGATGKYCERGE